MARTVDPERHEARRLHIIDAALTVFAERGYTGATTAAICRQAGIGSGTFFHYFGTKLAVLLAILQLGIEETQQQARELEGRTDPLGVLGEIVDRALAETTEPRLAGFVLAVGGVMGEPEVARALATDDAAQHDLLRTWIGRAQRAGQIRTDMSAGRLASWVQVLLGGFLERAAMDEEFTAAREGEELRAAVRHLLHG